MTAPEPPFTDPAEIHALSEAKSVEEAIPILARQFRFLIAPGQVVELRALKVRRGRERTHTEAGFFCYDHLEAMAKAALEVTKHARGVYFTLNPLNTSLLARRCNRIDWADVGELAKDKDVLARQWLLIDVDPVRDSHISATDDEKKSALDTIHAVREYLHSRSWPMPLVADSGNGFHLLYRIELPAADGGLVERLLRSLAARFDTEHVKIDQSVSNPARICKLPGTMACKGDHTESRPHRRAKLLEVPAA